MPDNFKPARLPSNEPERLDAVRRTGLIDTNQQATYKVYIQLAQTITQCPMVTVGLFDENQQYFLAHSSESSAGTGVAREITLCQYALLTPEPLIVEDLRTHPTLKNNPNVVGPPNFIFYAGFPLVTRKGLILGSFCMRDFVERKFDAAMIALIKNLAGNLSHFIELQMSQREAVADGIVEALHAIRRQRPDFDLAAVQAFASHCAHAPLSHEQHSLLEDLGLVRTVDGHAVFTQEGNQLQAAAGLHPATYRRVNDEVPQSVDELLNLFDEIERDS